VVDAGSGTVKVTVAMNNSDGRLRPGMFGRLQVQYDRREAALLIPKDAVLIEDASASVFTVAEGKASRRNVRLGYSNDWQYEVLEGLNEGEQVVTTGRASLKDGAPAEIVETAS
ncbi:MAG: efflux RND transporter periplasmic adaptor subunit, partial [Oceanococcaceae bacterium]